MKKEFLLLAICSLVTSSLWCSWDPSDSDLNEKEIFDLLLLHNAEDEILVTLYTFFLNKQRSLGSYQDPLLGRNIIHLAVEKQFFYIVTMCANNNMDLNKTDKMGSTALHTAVQHPVPNIALIKLLLRNKANPNIGDRHGATPFEWALKKNHTRVAKLLHVYGALPTVSLLSPRINLPRFNPTPLIGLTRTQENSTPKPRSLLPSGHHQSTTRREVVAPNNQCSGPELRALPTIQQLPIKHRTPLNKKSICSVMLTLLSAGCYHYLGDTYSSPFPTLFHSRRPLPVPLSPSPTEAFITSSEPFLQ